MELTYIFAEL